MALGGSGDHALAVAPRLECPLLQKGDPVLQEPGSPFFEICRFAQDSEQTHCSYRSRTASGVLGIPQTAYDGVPYQGPKSGYSMGIFRHALLAVMGFRPTGWVWTLPSIRFEVGSEETLFQSGRVQ